MLQMISKTLLLVGVSTALSGCLLTRNQDFNEAAREASEIAEFATSLPEVDAANLPETGTATYQGIAALNYEERLDVGSENNDYFSDITFETDFENGNVDGSMSNFQSPDGAVGGTLVLVDGQVFSNGVDGDFVGTLNDDGTEVVLDVGVSQSDFRGDGTGEPAALTGNLIGTYSTDSDEGEMLGSFVTEFVNP